MKNFLLGVLAFVGTAQAYEAQIKKGQVEPTLDALIQKASMDTGVTFSAENFQLIEQRTLATSNYTFYVQTVSQVPVAKTAVRIWKDKQTGELILAEVHLDEKSAEQEKTLQTRYKKARFSSAAIKSTQLSKAIEALVQKDIALHGTDPRVIGMKFKDQWVNGDLVREAEVRGRRGVHFISVSLLKNKIIKKSYREFPQSENIYGLVYPIYEEVEGTGERLSFEKRALKYIDTHVHDGGEDPLRGLNRKFEESQYSPLMAETASGEMRGLWSEISIRNDVEEVIRKLPVRENSFASGLLLSGKYATINLHPEVKNAFKNVQFELKPTTNHMLTWFNNGKEWEAKPTPGLTGKPILSVNDLLNRTPERLADHDTTKYINSGVDEVQVYFGVTTLMDSLVALGFTDPELSEKAFHAFLYDPDISMRDNAYYYDNTINFTTYSPNQPNYARDNPTIWHELGHAIMERLMGVHLGYADSAGGYGGLSEGMADFVAQIVVQDQTGGADFAGKNNFRIINSTGFYLTNEFHDEGEAFGGAMNDMLSSVTQLEGRAGLHAFTDLTLEAMRLTRNHPSLSTTGWFEHMLIADELGSSVREVGKYREIIVNALVARNFSFSETFVAASMAVTFNDTELTADSEGSRENPISSCGEDGVVSYNLGLKLTSGDSEFIHFPALVKIEYKQGALQGAIKWEGEESNPQTYTIHSEDELLMIPLKASLECEYVNQPDGSCKDYAYLQIFNAGAEKPVAKKRFYLKLNKEACSDPKEDDKDDIVRH